MSNVSFRNTDFVNNPIGNDRPIYGNEYIGPTPTPSPSQPYNCSDCSEWDITNTGTTEPLIVRYTQCNTTYTRLDITLNSSGDTESVCVCDNLLNPNANIEIIQGEGTLEKQFVACLPPPTPTPTPSPTPAFCVEYVVENEYPFPNGAVYYGCCDTEQTNHLVSPGTSYTFCAREIVQLGALTLVSSGASATCNSEIPCPSPTPTPTPSITPTITPSPTNCNCLQYDVYNSSTESQDTIGWLDCNYNSQEQTLNPETYLNICACAGSVDSRGGISTITNVGSCGITPTPSVTPTYTPTPSPTPYAYRYEVSNCDDALDVRIFWSDDFYAIGKVVKGYNDVDKCFEIVGSSTLPPTDEVANSYISCGSCPR